MDALRGKLAAAIKAAHAKAAAAADRALKAEASAKVAHDNAVLAQRATGDVIDHALEVDRIAREAMIACDDAVALLAHQVDPPAIPRGDPAATGAVAATHPYDQLAKDYAGDKYSPALDELSRKAMLDAIPARGWIDPTSKPAPGPASVDDLHFDNYMGLLAADPDMADHYAALPALPGGWKSRMAGRFAKQGIAPDRPGTALDAADFGALLRMAVAANRGQRTSRTP